MKKRLIVKQIVIVAICLTVVIIWRKQLSPGDTNSVYDTYDKNHDGYIPLAMHPLPRSQESELAWQPDSVDQPNVAHDKSEYIDDKFNNDFRIQDRFHLGEFDKREHSDDRGEKIQSNSETKLELFNEDSDNEYKTPETEKIEFENQIAVTERNALSNKKTSGDIMETFSHFDMTLIHSITPSMSKPRSRSSPTVNVLENPHRNIPQNDDNDDTNFVNFRFQKNFRRRDEELSRNMSESVHVNRKKKEARPDPEISDSKVENTHGPPENLLMKENRTVIKDDRNEFFGRMPSFGDYDLPVLKPSGQTKDITNGERKQETVSQQGSTSPPEEESLEPDDEIGDEDKTIGDAMEGVVIVGLVNASRKYAVFSATTEGRNSLSYIFYLPLTAFAWKRIGFDSIVIIVGSKDEWDSDPLLYHVLTAVRRLDCVVIFLEPRSEKSVMISQVARIFAANILRAVFPDIDGVFVITSDADLWPIYGDVYNLPRGKRILSLNSDCCSPFKHRGTTYKMLPMANIGMTVKTWRRVTRKFEESPKSIDDILTIFVQEFGTVALRAVHKGDNVGWYLDQMMISVLIAKWVNERGARTVKFSPRDVGVDRIDRAGWSYGQNEIADKVDAHLLLEAYIPGVWVRVTPLLRQMYGDMTEQYLWCVNYYEEFQKLFLTKYRSKET